MKKTSKAKRTMSAESIARLADNGRDISSFFTNKGKMMPPLNLGIDLHPTELDELNQAAERLNVSRQTLIRRFIRRGLDEHNLGQNARKVS